MNDPEVNRTPDLRFRKPESYPRALDARSGTARDSTRQRAVPHKVDTTESTLAAELARLRAAHCEVGDVEAR